MVNFSGAKRVGRFSDGDEAELYIRNNFLKSLGLDFEKIQEVNDAETPEGYILNQGHRIALIEVKLISYDGNFKSGEAQRITVNKTVSESLRKARRQLKSIETGLPKIIYLVDDNIFLDFVDIRSALLGDWTLMYRGSELIFSAPLGFHPNRRVRNKLIDSEISGIICYSSISDGDYYLTVIQNERKPQIPDILLDESHIKESWIMRENGDFEPKISLTK